MKDPFGRDLNGLLGGNSPLMNEFEKLLKDPNVPVKQKIQLLAGLGLSEVKSFKNSPEAAMLPLLVMVGLQQVQGQFKSLPKALITAQIDQKLSVTPKEQIEAKILEAVNKARAKSAAGETAPAVSVEGGDEYGLDDKAVNEFIADSLIEAGQDKFVDFSMAIYSIMPKATRAFFEAVIMPGEPATAEARAAKAYDMIVQTKDLQAYNNSGANGLNQIPAQDIAKAASEVASKVNGESVYQVISHIISKLNPAEAVSLVQNGLSFAEDVLTTTKNTGNPFNTKSAAGAAFAKALGAQTQLIEDAVIGAGLTPDTDLVASFKAALAAKDAAQPATTAPKAKKPRTPRTPK